jgi:tetratricopeptide (TPR) repeat protein
VKRLKLAQQMNDTSGMSLAYNGLGEVDLQQKNPAKALQHLTTAYNLALKVNDQEMMVTAKLSMAEAYYESDSLQRSISLFESALQLSKQMNYSTFMCNALIGLAKTKYKTGLLKEALANGMEALEKAESMGQVQLMRDANEVVSNIYEAMNDGNHALKYYRAYKVYSDSMNNLESQRAAAIEKAGYEFSKKKLSFNARHYNKGGSVFPH